MSARRLSENSRHPVMTGWEQEYRKLRLDECLSWTSKFNLMFGTIAVLMCTMTRITGQLGKTSFVLPVALTYITAGIAAMSTRVTVLLH